MRQKLFNLHNRLKNTFIQEMVSNIKDGRITFNPSIHLPCVAAPHEGINCNETKETFSVIFNPSKHSWFAHIGISTDDIDTEETELEDEWIPLNLLSFEELYTIAERL